MTVPVIYFWKKTPFFRLLLPFAAGILLQWYMQLPVRIWLFCGVASLGLLIYFFFIPLSRRWKLSFAGGIAMNLLFIAAGAALTWLKDIRNDNIWFGRYQPGDKIMTAILLEPPVQKTKSLKANAAVTCVTDNHKPAPARGKIILYFQHDSLARRLDYGCRVIFKKPVQEIKNTGNPGSFDYKRYSLFNGITHQVYLQSGDYEIMDTRRETGFQKLLFSIRDQVLNILRTHIKSEKERGLAEALLIGYKDDLDKPLVQSYTNTGVVHIIAISGLHLGLIYGLLVWLLRPLQKQKSLKWLRLFLILLGLWLFSLLAGGQPSVLRSALMFSVIAMGESIYRKGNFYNTLACSAFILLLINPYYLWDAGFQLSYAAVLSIVVFFQPIYNRLYCANRIIDFTWKLTAVTMAAQVLTLPVSIYHFHQFPTYFLLSNLVAVPLSSVILVGEIILCVVAFIPALASWIGQIITWLIWLLNECIRLMELLPFSVWEGLHITIVQALLLTLLITAVGYWLIEKRKAGLKTALLALLAFIALRSYSFISADRQQKIIVYNVPQKQAIDFIAGRKYFFYGDSSLLADDFLQNFHLKPSRILHRVTPVTAPDFLSSTDHYIDYRSRHILVLKEPVLFRPSPQKETIDLLVLSHNPKVYIPKLAASLNIRQVVIDGSAPAWRADYWKKDCDSLGIPYHDVSIHGAFVMNL